MRPRSRTTRSWSPQWVLDAVTAGPAADNRANLARFRFLDPASRRSCPGWDQAADITVAIQRTEAGRSRHDKDLHDLVDELSTCSDGFSTRWGAHDVRHHGTGTKRFHHHAVGGLNLAYRSLLTVAEPDLTLTARTAEPASPSEGGLRLCPPAV